MLYLNYKKLDAAISRQKFFCPVFDMISSMMIQQSTSTHKTTNEILTLLVAKTGLHSNFKSQKTT